MKRMVTIEILKKSQRTRPRKWIPGFAAIMWLLTLFPTLAYVLTLFPNLDASEILLSYLPAEACPVIGPFSTWYDLLFYFILPLALLALNLINVIFTIKTCKYRHGYWLFGILLVIAYIGFFLFTAFWQMMYFVPALSNFLSDKIPANVMALLAKIRNFGTLGYSAAFILYLMFLWFYNVNYPGRYEEIYELRRQRLDSFDTNKERKAYKKRFYRDYKKGNWDEMMLELHWKSFQEGSTELMRQDAYEFMVYYIKKCDDTIRQAVLDEYASQGRYLECRKIFHEVQTKSQAIKDGAVIHIPVFETRKKRRNKPAPLPPADATNTSEEE